MGIADEPDYEREYDNRGRVPEHPEIFAQWAKDTEAWRAERPPEVLPYGPGERRAVDLFAGDAGPVVLFIHGGYWQAMDRRLFSHLARGLNRHGVTVGIVGYDLCPAVTLDSIVEQVRAACRAVRDRTGERLVVSGHSAGGHLAACVLALESELVRVGYSISGLFDLRPLIETKLNAALRLTPEAAWRLSPLAWKPPSGVMLDAVVGGEESSEFHRQSREVADRWGAEGVVTRFEALAGANHFTAVAPLADPASAMVARLLALRAHA